MTGNSLNNDKENFRPIHFSEKDYVTLPPPPLLLSFSFTHPAFTTAIPFSKKKNNNNNFIVELPILSTLSHFIRQA
jgi:hypothetical protein